MSGRAAFRTLCMVVLTVACFESALADEATYRLCYRFQSGQFFHVETEDRAELTTQSGEIQSKSLQHTRLVKSYRVVTTDEDGGAIVEPIVEKVEMASRSGDKPVVSYDSSNQETPPKEFEKVASTVGRALARFHLAANGKLLKVSMLVTDVPKSFSDAAEKADSTINFLIEFPEKDLKVGDRWSEKYETPVRVSTGIYRPIQMIKSYELTSVTDNIAKIKLRTSVLTLTNDTEILRQLVQLTPTGTIEFDLQRGQILNRKLTFKEAVVGAFGPQTLLQSQGESNERLITPDSTSQVSSKDPAPNVK